MLARLIESREIAPEVRHFVFEAADSPSLDFLPGQWVSFSSLVDGKKIVRPYSIASAPDGNRFELCLNRVKEGRMSPRLFEMQPGETIEAKGPLGSFVPKQPFGDSVFVATGTGIAPFRAFLRDARVLSAQARVTLLFGARYESGLLYREEFEVLARSHPSFDFMPTITRPESTWTGRAGRVQQHLDEALAGRTGVTVYICGLKAMVDDVRAILLAKGFDKKSVIHEKYD
jgi:CDP-4-dehydro-6-deoxyglucose reductase